MTFRRYYPGLVFTVALTVPACGDKGGGTTTPTSTNRAPSASFTVDDSNPLIGATVLTFTASATDPDGDPLTYSWNLGDGSTKAGQIITHTYQTQGLFTAILTVTDSHGSNTSASNPVTARRLSGVWFSQARAWRFELQHTGPNISGRLLGFRDVNFGNPPPVVGVVRHPRMVEFDVEGGRGFSGTSDVIANQMGVALLEPPPRRVSSHTRAVT